MAQTSTTDYLGTAAPDVVGKKIAERFKKWRAGIISSGQYAQWVRNYSAYHNGPSDPQSTESWFDSYALEGDNAEILSIRINEMRNLITHIMNLTYSKPVGLRCVATNGEPKSMDAAIVADALLEDDFKSGGGTRVMRRAGEMAMITSTAFVMVEWDFTLGEDFAPDQNDVIETTGAPRMTDFWCDEVCFDGTKKDWRDVFDVILLRRRNKFELASRFCGADGAPPENETDRATYDAIINAAPVTKSPNYGLRSAEDDSDDIICFEYIHRKGNQRWLPDGRRVYTLENGTVIDDGPNPYAGMMELPVYPVTAAQGLGTVYGYAVANDISPINRFINLMASIVATNVAAYASPNIVGPTGAMDNVRNMVGGGRYFGVAPGQEVKHLDLMPNLKPTIDIMQMFSSYGEKLSGLAGVMRGDDAGNMSGKAIALVKSMAVQFMSSFQESVVEQHESVGNAFIWLRRNFTTGKQKIAKIGESYAQQVYEYDADTLGSIAGVRAEAVDPVSVTPEGREDRAQFMIQQKMISTPWEYMTLVKTGRDEPLYKKDMNTRMLIQNENASMMRGEETLVLQQDEHSLHMAEHLGLLADPKVRQDHQLVGVVLEHNAKHTMFSMGLSVLQGTNPQTGQPYPSAVDQLAQAKAQASQNQQQQQPQGAPQGAPPHPQTSAPHGPPPHGPPQGAPPAQPPPRPQTAAESLQNGAMQPTPAN